MKDQNQHQEQQSNSNVNIADDQEMNYWTKEFGIAKEELLAFVKHGGTFAAAVENYVKHLQFSL